MSVLSPEAPRAVPSAGELPTSALFCLSLICALALAWAFQLETARAVLASGVFGDSDDAMRMVQIRDLLSGQGFFDIAQHRVADGLPMHWSRLWDLPGAGLVRLLEPLVGPVTAERWMRLVVPAVTQAGFLAGLLWLALILGGRAALLPAAIVAGLALVAATQFAPGRIDHHGIQMTLTVLVAGATMRAVEGRAGHATLGGYLGATTLAIGLETAPFVAVAILALGIAWIMDNRAGPVLARFGSAFGAGALVFFLAGVAPTQWRAATCDAIGLPVLAAAAMGGLAMVGLGASGARLRGRATRLVAGVVAGLVVVAVLAWAFPVCRAGPYGVIPADVRALWLDGVVEARGLVSHVIEDPSGMVAVTGAALVGLIALAVLVVFGNRRRGSLLVLLGFALAALVVTLDQLRGAAFLATLTVPAAAVAVAMLWRASRPAAILVALLSIVPTWGMIAISLGTIDSSRSDSRACLAPEAVARLRDLPPGLIAGPVDLGAHILVASPHRVLGAPYHRNIDGIRAATGMLTAAPGEAEGIARRARATYVVLCPNLKEVADFATTFPNGLAATLLSGVSPSWLEPVPGDGPLRVWRVR